MNSSMRQWVQQILANNQQNAQGQVPVIPNNGNPMGANNMPSMVTQNGEDQPVSGYYPWMQPSPSMAYVHNMIGTMGTGGAAQVQQAPAMATGGNAQVLPVLPSNGNTGIVPPSMQTNPAQPLPMQAQGQHRFDRNDGVVMPHPMGMHNRTYVR